VGLSPHPRRASDFVEKVYHTYVQFEVLFKKNITIIKYKIKAGD
jgi:hypothetical protein